MTLGLDEEARLGAAARLVGRPTRDALDAALGGLADRSWRVRKAAVEAILAHPDREGAIEGLIAALRAEANAGQRNSAAEALVRLGTAAVPALLGRTGDPDPELRKFVIDVLGEIGDRRTVPALVGAIADGETNVRTSAAEALGKIGDERAVASLLAVLEGGDLWFQHAALSALGRIGRPLPRPLLTRLVDHPQLRRAVYDLIGQVRDAAAADLVLAGIGDRGRSTREAAIVAFWALWEAHPALEAPLAETVRARADGTPPRGAGGFTGAPVSWREALAAAIDSPAAQVRLAAGALLAVAGDSRGVAPLVAAVGDERLRSSALAALRAAGATAVQALEALLADPDEARRGLAAALLGELSDLNGRGVAELLADPSEEVQMAAVEALGRFAVLAGPSTLLDRAAPLEAAADAGHRRTAALLLGRLGDLHDLAPEAARAAAARLAFALKDADVAVRQAAAAALGRLRSGEGVDPLLLALADEAPEVRIEAAGALGRLRSAAAVEALALLVRDDDPWVRAAALRALGAVGAPAAFPVVAAALQADEPPEVLAAIDAAVAVGGDAAVPHLLPLLSSPEPEIVKATARVLASLGGAAVTAALIPLLSTPDWGVRAAAAEALGRRRAEEARPALQARLALEEDDVARGAMRRALEALG
jgi:HEAT repeat protein